jgi:predicted DNA-binding ribbon-helix-helix protein
LQDVARSKNAPVVKLVEQIERDSDNVNLSLAIRVFVDALDGSAEAKRGLTLKKFLRSRFQRFLDIEIARKCFRF